MKKSLGDVRWTLVALLSGTAAMTANAEHVAARVTFAAPIRITAVNALQYGLLKQSFTNLETVVITPDSTVIDTADRIVGGPQSAASFTVTATPGRPITILVDSVVNGPGYALGAFVCRYGTGADTVCNEVGYPATTVANATLLIGATLSGDDLAEPGVADGSFNVTVSYQ